MSMTRKEFCGGLAGGTVLLLFQGCGGGGGYAGSSSGGMMSSSTSCGASGSAIAGNHGHVLTIARADLDSMTDRVYSIMGTATHDHMVAFTAAMLAQLKAGQSVIVTSTNCPGHRRRSSFTNSPLSAMVPVSRLTALSTKLR